MKTFDLPSQAVYLGTGTFILTRLTAEVSQPLGLADVCVLELLPTTDRRSITLAADLSKKDIFAAISQRFDKRDEETLRELTDAIREFASENPDPFAIVWHKFPKPTRYNKPHILPIAEFVGHVKSGFFTTDDGFGRYCTLTHESDVQADLEGILDGEKPDPRFEYVVWFNR